MLSYLCNQHGVKKKKSHSSENIVNVGVCVDGSAGVPPDEKKKKKRVWEPLL